MPAAARWIYAVVSGFVHSATGKVILAKIVGAVVTAGAVLTANKILGKMLAPSVGDMMQRGISIQDNAPSNTAPIPCVYGRRQVGGTRIFIETTGTTNRFLHIVLAIAEGEVSELHQVYINNEKLYNENGSINEKFMGGDDGVSRAYVRVNFHPGTDDQPADEALIMTTSNATANWNESCKLSGICYAYVKLEYDTEIWSSGFPIVNFDISGKKVRDPRETTVDASGLLRFSDNPALCIRDYLTNSRYGRNISTSEINDASFITAANYCDEEITMDNITQKRYTANGVVPVGSTAINILEELLTACRGMLIFSAGQYKLVLDKVDSSVFSFTTDNMIGDITVAVGSKSTQWNRVKSTFYNKEKEWSSDFSIQDNSAARSTTDNGLLLEGSLELPYTSDYLTASMISGQSLKQSRESLVVIFKSTIEGLQVECGDVVDITSDSLGWTNKKFRVLLVAIEALDEISFTAKEYSDDVYTIGDIENQVLEPNTDLPDIANVQMVTNFTASEDLLFNKPTLINRVTLSWDVADDTYAIKYIVSMKKGNWSDPRSRPSGKGRAKRANMLGTTRSNEWIVDGLEPGVYNFFVRTENTAGIQSKDKWIISALKGVDILPAVNPPAITNVTESLYVTTTGTGVKARARLNFVASSGNTDWETLGVEIDKYEVQFKLSTDTTWTSPGTTSGNFFEFNDIAPGVHNFRIRAINDAAVASNWASSTQEIFGLTSAPADVDNFYIRFDSSEAHLSWDLVDDQDVLIGGTYQIRHSNQTSGATWGEARILAQHIAGAEQVATVALLVGTYMIKAIDSTAHKSDNATSIVNTVSPNLFETFVAGTQTESNAATGWAGTKTNLIVDSDNGYLKFDSALYIDDVTIDMDDWALFDSLGELETTGTYEFTTYLDFGLVGSLRLSSDLTFTTLDISGYFDSRAENIDSWADFDALEVFDDVTINMFVAATDDDPSGTPTWGSWQQFTIGNIYGRAFKFKLVAVTCDSSHQINIAESIATMQAFYRLQQDRLTTTTSAFSVTFDSAFASIPSIAVSGQDLATGDYFTISSPAATGFSVQFFNSSDSGVARTFDYLARGY